MRDINLSSWEEFEEQLKKLENGRLQQKSLSEFLYRGQGDHTWCLLTTLERNWQEEGLLLEKYQHLIFTVKPQIESFTGVNWSVLSPPQYKDWLEKHDTFIPNAFGHEEFQDTYSYMAYLRHYGFPSPLLDWSSSPYVATYFAFEQASHCKNSVSIYVFLESKSNIGLKSGSNDKPHIHKLGPYVRTDRRHFLQQSQYTICIIRDGEWQYSPHRKAFDRCDPDQDLLWKFNIPYSERLKVLRLLDRYYNINALSLFGSKESLMKTMALRQEIRLRDRKP